MMNNIKTSNILALLLLFITTTLFSPITLNAQSSNTGIKVGDNYGVPADGTLTMSGLTENLVVNSLVDRARQGSEILYGGNQKIVVGKGTLFLNGERIKVLNPKDGNPGGLRHSRALAKLIIKKHYSIPSRSKYSMKQYGYPDNL